MNKTPVFALLLLLASCAQTPVLESQDASVPEGTPLQVQTHTIKLTGTDFVNVTPIDSIKPQACYDMNGNGRCDDFRNNSISARRLGVGASSEVVYREKFSCRTAVPCNFSVTRSTGGTVTVTVNAEYTAPVASAGVTLQGSYTWNTQVGASVNLNPNTCAEYRVVMNYDNTRGDYSADFYEEGLIGTYGGVFIGRFNIPGKSWNVKRPTIENKGFWSVRC